MYCLICPESKRRKTQEEWSGICGVCKNLSQDDLDYLYWIQEESPERVVIAPIKLRMSQFASRRRYEDAWSHIPSNARVLEIGCASGLGLEFAGKTSLYVAFDLASSELRYAKQHQPAFRIVLANGTRIPFGSASFDVVICLDVVEHLTTESMLEVFQEAARVLPAGGKFILSTPSGEITPAKYILGRKVHETHVVEYTKTEMFQHMQQTGFENLDCYEIRFPHFPSSLFGQIAQNIVPEIPWMINTMAKVTWRLGYFNCLYVATKARTPHEHGVQNYEVTYL